LPFRVLDNEAFSEQLVVTASSSNPSLVPSVNVIVGQDTVPDSLNWILSVTPAANQTGTTTISLTVTDDAGLSAKAFIKVTVMFASNVSMPDPGLEAAIRSALGKFEGDLTSVDLLALSDLFIDDPNITNLFGLEWATNLTTLSLSGNSITSLISLQSLTGLTSLSLYKTSVTDLSPLKGLANLISLNLIGNPITNYGAVLPGLTNLTSMDLGANSISDLTFLQNLTQLTTLFLNNNRISDISPLAGLTNLSSLGLRQNLLTNMVPLQNLPRLSYVDGRLNLLDLNTHSPAMTVVENLQSQGVIVDYLPQRESPVIEARANWLIALNTTSLLSFRVLDVGASSEQLVATARSSNPSLVPNANVIAGQDTDPDSLNWTLRVTPATNQAGATTISLTATNDVGLGTIATVLVTVVLPQPLDNGLFDTNLTWITYGNAPWFGQNVVTPDGLLVAQSGAIGDGEESRLETTLTGPGTLSFWWKVSSETDHDWLEIYVNGVLQPNRISGEVNWQQQTITLPSGTHTLGWRYSKDPDPDSSIGRDAGWLAQISFAPTSWLELAGRPTNGQCQVIVYGATGHSYEVQASTDLVNWFPLGVAVTTNGVMSFFDDAAVATVRFYRLRDRLAY